MKKSFHITCIGALLSAAIVTIQLLLPGTLSLSPIENIHGIPYPKNNQVVFVEEELAHTDVYLNESVFARSAHVTVTFNPATLQKLSVGIRENDFWLSYPKEMLWTQPMQSGWQQAVVEIPLRDKIVDFDGSVDLMFFAETVENEPLYWELKNISLETKYAFPTKAEAKDFIRGILYRERPK